MHPSSLTGLEGQRVGALRVGNTAVGTVSPFLSICHYHHLASAADYCFNIIDHFVVITNTAFRHGPAKAALTQTLFMANPVQWGVVIIITLYGMSGTEHHVLGVTTDCLMDVFVLMIFMMYHVQSSSSSLTRRSGVGL